MAKQIRITIDDAEHDRLKDLKNGRTWHDVLVDGAEVQADD